MFFAREPNCRGASRILGYPLRTMVGGIESLLFSVAFEFSESGPWLVSCWEFAMPFPSTNEAQRLVDELLWAAVKSHTVKVWGKGDRAKLATSCLG